MSKSTWNTIFSQSGFSELECVLDDYAGHQSSSVLISTAVDTDTLPGQLAPPQVRGLTVVGYNQPPFLSCFAQYKDPR